MNRYKNRSKEPFLFVRSALFAKRVIGINHRTILVLYPNVIQSVLLLLL